MEKLTLLESRPTILGFRRAMGATVKKGSYDQHPDGRPYDCFAYILKGAATGFSSIYYFSNAF